MQAAISFAKGKEASSTTNLFSLPRQHQVLQIRKSYHQRLLATFCFSGTLLTNFRISWKVMKALFAFLVKWVKGVPWTLNTLRLEVKAFTYASCAMTEMERKQYSKSIIHLKRRWNDGENSLFSNEKVEFLMVVFLQISPYLPNKRKDSKPTHLHF